VLTALRKIMLTAAPYLAWSGFVAALIAVGRAPASQRFPGVLLTTFIFAAVLTWLPRCRPVVTTPICPWNWALLVFALQLVGLPLLITLDRPSLGVLPALPSSFAINMAMVLSCVAFVTVCAVYNHCSKFQIAHPDDSDRMRNTVASGRHGSPGWVAAAALLGLTGMFLSFGNIAGVIGYFNDPGFYRSYFADASSTWRGLTALLLKPFLGFAVIMTWCRWMDRGHQSISWLRASLWTVGMLAGVVTTFSFFAYNRGSVAVPLVAVAAVAMAKSDKCSWRTIATAGVLVLALSPIYAIYRSGTALGENLVAQSDLQEMFLDKVDLSDLVQMYGNAPQYLGFLLERSHWGREPYWGAVTVSSILSPLPVLGKPFRQTSGFTLYNRLIYGSDDFADQASPFQGETFLDLHVLGVILGYAIFGWILHRLQRAFERCQSSLEIYIWQYLSVWISFVIFGSVGVTSQTLIYFCWPIYAWWCTTNKSRLALPLCATAKQEA
jgi:hypothetical protein